MFNSSKQKTPPISTYEDEAQKVVTLIGAGATCDGAFSARDTTRIDGTINGPVHIEGSLIVGQSGKVNGDVTAQNVFLAGEITGNIDCNSGKLEVSDSGKLVGDVTTKSIVIDENAIFQGRCTMTTDINSATQAKERAAATVESDSK
jgi:cytoskeletal protein CcmA (bactofilin family)